MLTRWRFLLFLSCLLIATLYYFNLHQYLSFDFFKNNKDFILLKTQDNFALSLIAFSLLYILLTAISFPAASGLSLLGGLMFGLTLGTVVVLFSATIGSTLAFLIARNLFSEPVKKKYSTYLKSIEHGLKENGPYFLFALRLNPVIPFFAINLVMGLTPIKIRQFFWISLVGMLPGTMLYVNAGAQVANISSPRDLISMEVILSFILLGLAPLIVKQFVQPKILPGSD